MEQDNTNEKIEEIETDLEENNQEIDELGNRVDVVERQQQLVKQETMTMRSGPLPSPEDLEYYEKVHPGAAMEIINMAKKEQNHRIDMEQKEMNFQTKTKSRDSLLGILTGILIVLCAFGTAIYLSMNGHETVASVIVGSTLLGLFGTVINNTRIDRRNRED